jgi:hypothetical protein
VAATVDVKRWMKRRSRRVYYFIYLLFYGPGWMKTDMRPFACALSRPHARLHLSQMHTQTQMRTDMVTPCHSHNARTYTHTHTHIHTCKYRVLPHASFKRCKHGHRHRQERRRRSV